MNGKVTKNTVTVIRRFPAPAGRVFDAWLDPEQVRKFLFVTPAGKIMRVEIDARVGGWFIITDRREGENVDHTGEYLEIDRPRRLVFTFSVPKYTANVTRVAIDIVALKQGCALTLTHDGVWTDYVERTRSGWAAILEGLAGALG